MDEQERKQLIQKTFDTVAASYDHQALRFFARSAAQLPGVFQFAGDEHVLDVATGTGMAALALASQLPQGKVTGVDFSTGMLSQAREKARQGNLGNLDFQQMDMTAMDWPDACFDAANCSFAVFFIEDMHGLVRHIADKVKPGGRVVATGFHDGAFSPNVDLFLDRIQRYGLEPPIASWKRIDTEEKFAGLYRDVGLKDVKTHRINVGYHLKDADDWWNVIWNAGYRGLVAQFTDEQLERFKQEHLAEIQDLATGDGVWLNVEVIIAEGRA